MQNIKTVLVENQTVLYINENKIMSLQFAIRELCAAMMTAIQFCNTDAHIRFEAVKPDRSPYYGISLSVSLRGKSAVVMVNVAESAERAVAYVELLDAVFDRLWKTEDKGRRFMSSCFADSHFGRTPLNSVELVKLMQNNDLLSQKGEENLKSILGLLEGVKPS